MTDLCKVIDPQNTEEPPLDLSKYVTQTAVRGAAAQNICNTLHIVPRYYTEVGTSKYSKYSKYLSVQQA